MSQRVNDILQMISELTPAEKNLLVQSVASGGSSNRGYGYRNKSESYDAINFAPRSGSKCPVCGKQASKHTKY